MTSAEPATWNRYAYVTNSPLEMTDPTGLIESDNGSCIGGQQKNPDGTISDCIQDITVYGGDDPFATLWANGDESSGFGDCFPCFQQPWDTVTNNPGGGNGNNNAKPETPLQCIARASGELNPANLLGLGDNSTARGLFDGPLTGATAFLAGQASEGAAAGIANGIGPAAGYYAANGINPSFTVSPYITTLTESPAMTVGTLPLATVASGIASFVDSITPLAIAVDFTTFSIAAIGCGAFE